MIEAMACGTPVIAFRGGSVDEVVDNGVTGFVVENIDDAVRAVNKLSAIRREDCRGIFEKRFSASRMAKDYLKIYDRLIGIRNQNSDLEYLMDSDLRTTR
jgi:glycosyltransferase involved in cell wall biosynthesis